MAFKPERFFDDLTQHLGSRAATVRSLAVQTAIERWVQMEAAALLDLSRTEYGLRDSGGTAWWVTCEYRRVDIWLQGPNSAVAIELKSIHNNKNFINRVASLQHDLTEKVVPRPQNGSTTMRMGIVVATYAQYVPGARDWQPLRTKRSGPFVERELFLELLRESFRDKGLRLSRLTEVASLEGARHVCPGSESAVWLGLVKLPRIKQHR